MPVKRLHTVCALLSLLGVGLVPAAADEPLLADVESAFERIPQQGSAITFPRGDLDVPGGGHIQGIQLKRDPNSDRLLAFLSHDSRTIGYVVVAAFDWSLEKPGRVIHVHRFAKNGLRHAGGIQLLGNILTVGMEDNQAKDRSEVQFWDVSNPKQWHQLRHLTIERSGPPKKQTAGAVGIVNDGDNVIVAVANWDSRDIDFYRSTEADLPRATCRFRHVTQWSVASADKSAWQPDTRFGSYQSINLLRQSDGQTYLCGFYQSGRGPDVADLFAVDLTEDANRVLVKRASKQIVLSEGRHFRYGGGLRIHQADLWLMATERSLREQVIIDVVR